MLNWQMSSSVDNHDWKAYQNQRATINQERPPFSTESHLAVEVVEYCKNDSNNNQHCINVLTCLFAMQGVSYPILILCKYVIFLFSYVTKSLRLSPLNSLIVPLFFQC